MAKSPTMLPSDQLSCKLLKISMVYAVLSLTILSTNQRGSNRLVVVKNMVEPYVI